MWAGFTYPVDNAQHIGGYPARRQAVAKVVGTTLKEDGFRTVGAHLRQTVDHTTGIIADDTPVMNVGILREIRLPVTKLRMTVTKHHNV